MFIAGLPAGRTSASGRDNCKLRTIIACGSKLIGSGASGFTSAYGDDPRSSSRPRRPRRMPAASGAWRRQDARHPGAGGVCLPTRSRPPAAAGREHPGIPASPRPWPTLLRATRRPWRAAAPACCPALGASAGHACAARRIPARRHRQQLSLGLNPAGSWICGAACRAGWMPARRR